jgi:serine/threonine protein kinase
VGFVHCDVKPANVRLHPRLEYHSLHAVLLDWGYARRIGDQSEPITQGSPAYAAPEQLTGYSTDGVCARASLRPAVDVWSLGATLCEMLSGAPPFGGRDFERLKANVLGLHFVASACTIRPGSAARDLMDAMLQIHPTDRASLPDCCVHAWVQGCGELPPPSDILLGLQCDDCEGPENTSTRGLTKLKSATGLMRWLPGGLGTGAPASRTLGLAIYIVLCGAALLWTQSGPAVGNSGVQFVLAEEG